MTITPTSPQAFISAPGPTDKVVLWIHVNWGRYLSCTHSQPPWVHARHPKYECKGTASRGPRPVNPPVIAVEVIQPATFLHQLDGPWGVEPGGITVQSLVLFTLAALKAALVGPLCTPVIIVVHTLPGLCFAQTVPWDGQKAPVSSHCNEMKLSGGSADIWCRIRSVPRRKTWAEPLSSLWHMAKFQELSVVKKEFLRAKKLFLNSSSA